MLEDSNRLLCAAACFSTSLLHWLSTLARFCVFRPSHVVYVFAPRSSTHHYKAEHFGVFVFNINIPTTWPDCELPTNCVWLNSSVGLGRVFYTTCDSQAEHSATSTKRKYNTLTSHQSFQIRHLFISCCKFEFYADFEKFYLLCSHLWLLSSITVNLVFSLKLKVFNIWSSHTLAVQVLSFNFTVINRYN